MSPRKKATKTLRVPVADQEEELVALCSFDASTHATPGRWVVVTFRGTKGTVLFRGTKKAALEFLRARKAVKP